MTDERFTSSVMRKIPRIVWALGLVSLFMDLSSEMIHAVLPLYLVSVLGVSPLTVGFIEGIAEATANTTKVFSGAISDRLGRRKLLASLGYGMAAITKPIFPLADSFGWILAARFLDRVGKGIRDAPRDALIADVTPPQLRGASFGLRQSLDTIGAFVAPLTAIGLMELTSDSFKTVFWIAVLPAFLAVGLMLFGVEEPARSSGETNSKPRPRLRDIPELGLAFWLVVAVGTVLTLARFSEAFLLLRARNVGLPVALTPVVMVVMNAVYAGAAYPAGVLSDRLGRNGVLSLGVVFLIVADLLFALASTIPLTLVGVAFWGLHMGFTQGLFATLVADTAPENLRGTAFGLFNLLAGLAMLAASVIAGALWDVYGASATFLAGGVFTVLAFVGTLGVQRRLRKTGT